MSSPDTALLPEDAAATTPLHRGSSVCAILPHFNCNEWLGDAIQSLLDQTIPLAAIAVIDDVSDELPEELVRQFPTVTLFASAVNTGPYRLSQTIIDATGYDAYLFQDADDVSLPNRLESLLLAGERTGAELIGCQGYRVILGEADAVPLTYPIDAGSAIRRLPTRYAILHPTSIVSRDLNQRIGGLATGMKYGGDTEFQHRASHVAVLANAPDFGIIKRQHGTALTARADTGLRSQTRQTLNAIEYQRAKYNAELAKAGHQPNTDPLALAGAAPLRLVCGPTLRGVNGGEWPR